MFPAIASLSPGSAGSDELAARIGDLVAEHTAMGAEFARLRELTDGYTTPADGCPSYRSLYERLSSSPTRTSTSISRATSCFPLLWWRRSDTSAPSGAERAQPRMFTAREITTATVTNEANDWSIISSFAHGVSGIVSVGLKAVAFVNDV